MLYRPEQSPSSCISTLRYSEIKLLLGRTLVIKEDIFNLTREVVGHLKCKRQACGESTVLDRDDRLPRHAEAFGQVRLSHASTLSQLSESIRNHVQRRPCDEIRTAPSEAANTSIASTEIKEDCSQNPDALATTMKHRNTNVSPNASADDSWRRWRSTESAACSGPILSGALPKTPCTKSNTKIAAPMRPPRAIQARTPSPSAPSVDNSPIAPAATVRAAANNATPRLQAKFLQVTPSV